MMLNKISAYLYILSNDIYTGTNSLTNIYLFVINNSNARKRCEIYSKLTIKLPQRCSTAFIVNFEHVSYLFTLFLSVKKNSCSHELCIYNVFDRNFYLRRILISKEHLQPYIWVVPSFQEVACIGLVFSRVLSFFKITNCNRVCLQRYWVNSPQVRAIYSTNGPFLIIKEQL